MQKIFFFFFISTAHFVAHFAAAWTVLPGAGAPLALLPRKQFTPTLLSIIGTSLYFPPIHTSKKRKMFYVTEARGCTYTVSRKETDKNYITTTRVVTMIRLCYSNMLYLNGLQTYRI